MESFTLILSSEETIGNLLKIGVSVTEEDGRFITYNPSGNRIELALKQN